MGDESCIYGYDPETKQQLSQWKSPQLPRPTKERQVRVRQSACSLFFLSTVNLCLLTLWSTLTFTVTL
jgi:hypothetical protein